MTSTAPKSKSVNPVIPSRYPLPYFAVFAALRDHIFEICGQLWRFTEPSPGVRRLDSLCSAFRFLPVSLAEEVKSYMVRAIMDEQGADKAREAIRRATDFIPSPHSWVYYSRSLGPGGLGRFCWFHSKQEMLDFVGQYHTYLFPGQPVPDRDALQTKLGFMTGAAQRGTIPFHQALGAVNQVLKGHSIIEWWGTLAQLLTDTSDFAREYRQLSREALRDEERFTWKIVD